MLRSAQRARWMLGGAALPGGAPARVRRPLSTRKQLRLPSSHARSPALPERCWGGKGQVALPRVIRSVSLALLVTALCAPGPAAGGLIERPAVRSVLQGAAQTLLQGVRLKSSASSSRIPADHQQKEELFREWLTLAGATTLSDLTAGDTPPITKGDALVIIDMQQDFVPASGGNPDGGRFGVAEGEAIVAPICSMIKAASDVGALILASRDYHPHDHCSFSHQGGHFPSHCVQGTEGSKFLPEISEALETAMQQNGPDHVLVAFKAMHEHVDSFGALPYAKEPFGEGRVSKAADAEPEGLGRGDFSKFGAVMGCTQAPWTGSLVLKQSAIAAAADDDDDRADDGHFDANAPPDVLAVLQDGVDRNLRTMQDVLNAKLCPEKGRIFVCGLALDFCVHDTCVNAIALGMQRVSIIVDAARAAHVPGLGSYGSGFLSEPSAVKSSLASSGVKIVSFWDVLPEGYNVPRVHEPGIGFPAALGPIGLKSTSTLNIELRKNESIAENPHCGGQYTLELTGALKPLAHLPTFSNVGVVSPITPLPKNWPGVGKDVPATHVCWAYPMHGVRDASFQTVSKSFLAISAKVELNFAAYGGFLLLDAAGNVLQTQTVGENSLASNSIHFEKPRPWTETGLLKLLGEAGRLQTVTLPSLRAKGAEQFCWISPGEESVSEKPGGFIYLFSDGSEPLYFPLCASVK